MPKFSTFFFLFLLFAPCLAGASLAASQAKDNAARGKDALHASPWAFGQSSDRNDAIWKKGRTGKEIYRDNPQGKIAISDGRQAAREAARKNRRSLGLTMKDQSGTWKVAPERKDLRPDERRLRDNRHIVSAYADLEASDDFSIRVGPELILRDDTKGDETARADQPETVLGLGMNFKYDF